MYTSIKLLFVSIPTEVTVLILILLPAPLTSIALQPPTLLPPPSAPLGPAHSQIRYFQVFFPIRAARVDGTP